jgi:hypothetical protein
LPSVLELARVRVRQALRAASRLVGRSRVESTGPVAIGGARVELQDAEDAETTVVFEATPIVEAREITRVAVTPQHSAFIAGRIACLAEEAPTSQRWLKFMEVHQVLPLCSGWTWTLGIKPDGTLVRIPTEGEWSETSQEFPDRTAANVALMEGAARYPELRDLIPSRPEDAEPCPTCGGTGELPPPIRCICGGLGWLPPIRS